LSNAHNQQAALIAGDGMTSLQGSKDWHKLELEFSGDIDISGRTAKQTG
jgi:hypothetical protein